eukprot:CAMPEP_0202692642 /NCGR_PEP_ID=MMETSP1385-20130828/6974_1 /ASSEMBLY_ACC=CAM_ASM_000861 /TAXON_ID=933848 /ORGANISM="Elphidium margaritaceum" /LENGTH=111 /DNA_ID=CAMNT_0049348217 /DNA_START=59 /DNA_END=390 /DNA_ORIENTATION=+
MSQPASSFNSTGPIQQCITQKLTQTFNPTHLEVINESNQHNVPKGSETHFKVVIVSTEFDGKSKINQHRLVNETLKDELNNNVHALSIKTKTPQQWSKNSTVDPSPPCLGG